MLLREWRSYRYFLSCGSPCGVVTMSRSDIFPSGVSVHLSIELWSSLHV